jgi:dGTPase
MTSSPRIDLHEMLLDREEKVLSKWGFRSRNSEGRAVPEPPSPTRTPFQRDRDRIIHSKAFRRLMHKTQVFLSPDNDHFRTRLTHTLEVTQIARGIGRALGLNEDLIEAISLGHDLGHTPFGHAGESVLDSWCRENGIPGGFQHHMQSVRVVEKLENDGRGLNLTREVVEGIRRHTKGRSDYQLTLDDDESLHWEGRVVKIADRVAYVNHDLQDAIEAGILVLDDIPTLFTGLLGETNSERINAMASDIIYSTLDAGQLTLSPHMKDAINGLKDFLFDRVYEHPKVREHDHAIRRCLFGLLDTLLNEQKTYEHYVKTWVGDKNERLQGLVDYVAGMTDRYAVRIAAELLIPEPWPMEFT